MSILKINFMPIDFLTNKSTLLEESEILMEKLFPICRSITGNGVRESLSILQDISNFQVNEIESGTECFDWTIPDEWNVNSAYLEDENGNKILDFKNNNLHLLNYSIPIDKIITFDELEKHVYTLPNLPDAIPYRTSYYSRNWGFCMSHNQFQSLDPNLKYHVNINTSLKSGSLSYGEEIIHGESGIEFIFSSYCCHPSLANDNLSGMILWILLLRELKKRKMKHTYRFTMIPETIGAIAYLHKNQNNVKDIFGGYILTCIAGPGKFSYKETFLGNHMLDQVSKQVLSEFEPNYILNEFDINGSDETHFSSPYFRIPMGTICKDKYYDFDYYHTSFDNLEFIDSKNIIKSLEIYLKLINKLETTDLQSTKSITNKTKQKNDIFFQSLNPCCEPMLSKRGLYPSIGGQVKQTVFQNSSQHNDTNYSIDEQTQNLGSEIDAISWLMFYADEKTSLETISKKSKIPILNLKNVLEKLINLNLIKKLN